MAEFHIKRIELPSGKVVELVYLQAGWAAPAGAPAPADASERVGLRRIELCPQCGSDRVHPLDWREVEDLRWELDVRCPDCRWTGGDVYEQPEVERYDDVLLADAGDLTEELDRITRANMAEHLERFCAALDADAITPFDF
jgi:DNA-directed RNA polymerase subunit RPC12/RpoP